MAANNSSFVAKWRKTIASEIPAACAISFVVAPRKPRREKRATAARSIESRRSSPAIRPPAASGSDSFTKGLISLLKKLESVSEVEQLKSKYLLTILRKRSQGGFSSIAKCGLGRTEGRKQKAESSRTS